MRSKGHELYIGVHFLTDISFFLSDSSFLYIKHQLVFFILFSYKTALQESFAEVCLIYMKILQIFVFKTIYKEQISL